MKRFCLALSFLTVIPSWRGGKASEEEMAASLFYYPLVGLVLGSFLVAVAYLGHILQLGLAGDVLTVVVGISLTGGLHWDGLMDTADGIFSGRSKEKRLEIMRDSRIGAMGAVALASVLLLKVAFLNQLIFPEKLWVLFLTPALGRTAMLLAITFFPYARSGPGLGNSFGGRVSRKPFWLAVLPILILGYLFGRVWGLWILIITGVPAAVFCYYVANLLGGHTGDTYGAVCEITEAMFLVAAVIIMKIHIIMILI